MADGVWKGVYTLIFGTPVNFNKKKNFVMSTPSMGKVDNRGETGVQGRNRRK